MPSSDWKVEIVDASGDADYSVTVVGDQVVDLTGASAGDVLTVQGDGTVAPDPPAVSSATPANASRTSGNFNVNGTAWADLDTGLDLALTNIAAGDWVAVSMNGRWSSNGVEAFVDVASLVAGAPVNYWSGNNGGASSAGVGAWYGENAVNSTIGGVILKQIVAGDLSAGTLTLRFRVRTSAVANKLIFASADIPLHVSAWKVH